MNVGMDGSIPTRKGDPGALPAEPAAASMSAPAPVYTEEFMVIALLDAQPMSPCPCVWMECRGPPE